MTCPLDALELLRQQEEDRFLDCEHDDLMTADDYDARRWERDGWGTAHLDRQRW
jgi:hypothetical protein